MTLGDLNKKLNLIKTAFELPNWHSYSPPHSSSSKSDKKRGGPREEEQVFLDDLARLQMQEKEASEEAEALRKNLEQETENLVTQAEAVQTSSTNIFCTSGTNLVNTVSTTTKASGTNFVNTVSIPVSTASTNKGQSQEDDSEIPPLEDIHKDTTDGIFTHSSYDDERGARLRLSSPSSSLSLSSSSPLLFEIEVWILVDLPYGKKAIGTKWVYRNKKDERGVVVRNKARLVAQGHRQEEGIDNDEVFAPVYVSQPPGFQDPKSPEKVYKVVKALYGLYQAPRACTPFEIRSTLVKDEEASDVDVPSYRYLKGKPKLGLWYPRESSFDLESYSDSSDYAGANLDRKSTTGGCQFLGRRLITWQCKKQTIVATSTTEAEYVAAASCCGQVLWIQNQMLDYGFNFMNTKIYIDNESTICIVKNPVYHSKTKHIAIRHHFIRDAYEKKLIQVLKIHTNDNVADLPTKAFDVSRFQFLVVSNGMINP
ncbi:putative ribonuclease H-like domain-containing protein [Tanacetum coccineum]